MAKTLGWIALAAASVMMAPACLKAKDRAWQTGTVLDTYKNIYFGDAEYKPVKDAGGSAVQDEYGTYAVAMNDSSSGKVFRQNYVIDSPASAFLVSITQLKAFKEPHLSFVKPVKFAVEKNKLWFVDLDGQQYEAKILKRLDKNKPVIAQRRQPVAVAKPVALAKPVTVAKAESVKPPTRPQVRISETDRAWQAGQLLSLLSNPYFAKIGYTSEADGGNWTLVRGKDGRYSAAARASSFPQASVVYDNYVIESEFCVYLVQHQRSRSGKPARFPGTRPLKFAVEKNKLWVIGEDGNEYETRIVKLLEKDSRPTGIQTAAR